MSHCNLCGRAVAPNAYRVFARKSEASPKGLTVCADCERTQPRCIVCHTPISAERAELGICRDCLQQGLRCRACGKPISQFLLVNASEGPYCERCFETHTRCNLCGALTNNGTARMPDGRIVCRRCHETSVRDPREASVLYQRVIDHLANSLGMELNIRPRLVLVDHARLAELSRISAAGNGHGGGEVLGLFVRQGQRRFIYLQELLPRPLLIQIASHEYAHAWQGEQCPLLRDLIVREGFAEWVAYHSLLEMDEQDKGEQMLRRHDHYGAGLRHMLDIERRHGVTAVLDYCRAA
jgi:hypothetical protein